MDEVLAILGSAGRIAPFISSAASELKIIGNESGIARGYFFWPYNYDPIWLKNCEGFEPKDTQ